MSYPITRYRFHQVRSCRSMMPGLLINQQSCLVFYRSPVKQISPNKSINFRCTKLPHPAHAPYLHPCRQLHHLRWPLNHLASSSWSLKALSCTRRQPTPHMMFLFISSQFCIQDNVPCGHSRFAHGLHCVTAPSDHSSRISPCHSLVVII